EAPVSEPAKQQEFRSLTDPGDREIEARVPVPIDGHHGFRRGARRELSRKAERAEPIASQQRHELGAARSIASGAEPDGEIDVAALVEAAGGVAWGVVAPRIVALGPPQPRRWTPEQTSKFAVARGAAEAAPPPAVRHDHVEAAVLVEVGNGE